MSDEPRRLDDDIREIVLEPYSTTQLRKEAGEKGTTQNPEDGLPSAPSFGGIVDPPMHLQGLSRLSTINTTRRSVIEAVVRNTVALGLTVQAAPKRPEMPKAQMVRPEPAPEASPVTGATPPGKPAAPAGAPTGSPTTKPAAAKPDPTGAVAPAEPAAAPPAPEPVKVEPTEEAKEAARAAQRAFDATKRLDELAAKDVISDSPTFLGLLAMVKTDEEECGNGAIEVSRNKVTAEIDGLYYAPGNRVRRRWSRKGYIIIDELRPEDESKATKYVPFGAEVELGDDGKPEWKEGASKLNELLIFRLMTSESRDYGLPRDAALILDYLGDKGAADTNANFFGNSGVPPTLLAVSGGTEAAAGGKIKVTVPDGIVKQILATIRSGADNYQGRVAVIPVPAGGTIESVSLAASNERDVGYTKFRADVVTRVLATFRLGPIFLGISGDTVTLDPEVQRALAQEQVFDAEQGRYERRLSSTILPHLGFGDLEIKLKKMAVEGDAAKRESAERSAEVSTVTNGEFREAHGQSRLIEDGVRIPEGWNDELVKPKGGAAPGQSTPTPPVNAAEDQRGQKPGLGGRVPRGTENPEHARRLTVAKGSPEAAGEVLELSLVELHQRRLDDLHAPEGAEA